MQNLSHTEENYLKAIFKITEGAAITASTNAISGEMNTSAASVTDMVIRLSKKELVDYKKRKGVRLTPDGLRIATHLIRKHRLWEVFLVEKLNFSWDEVHDIAEQLEHIKSLDLVERLDNYLGTPRFDPHGDPIPDADGKFTFRKQILLADLKPKETGVVVGVQDHTTSFLQYLDQLQLVLGAQIELLERFTYDESVKVMLNNSQELILSKKVCQNLFIQKKTLTIPPSSNRAL